MSERAAPSLSGVLGQDHAVATLRAALSAGRVHHAWIFSGPQGVGKRTAADAFAAALLDPSTGPTLSGELEPDPDSQVQRLIAQGSHPDLHVITKELARFSDDKKTRDRKLLTIPRQVIEERLLRPIARASSLPGGLAAKVFIVDEAELLDPSPRNAPVQNSLLKTLEEPPPGSVIILVTSAEEMLLPTIRSRCQRVVFGSLDRAAMEAWFKRSGLDVSGAEREWLMDFAGGSPGMAQRAVEGGMYEWSRTLEPMLASADRGSFTPGMGVTLAKLVDDWAQGWVKAHENASKEAANLAGTRHLLALLAERQRRGLRAASGAAEKIDRDRVDRLLASLEAVEQAERHVAAHVPIAHAMERLAIALAAR
ncbi:MAG: AAA family ATPase [Planctomycetota bacterium]|nr:AAA family ATPase [Planctomycetota bacterium]